MIVGVLGAGQLGRMLALAGAPMGIGMRFFDEPSAEGDTPPAAQLAPWTAGEFSDVTALRRFAVGLTVGTYEFENVPVTAARALAASAPVFPSPEALATAQDRAAEKTLFARLGIGTPAWRAVGSRAEFDAALHEIGAPSVLKTRRLGYDGKGQAVIRGGSDAERAWADLGGACAAPNGPGLVLEAFVAFEREVSIIGVRGRAAQGAARDDADAAPTAFYPLIENRHAGGILRMSRVGGAAGGVMAATSRNTLETQARAACLRVMRALDYVGVCCIEFFQVRDADGAPMLLANEMACRVHNSGHWTIEGARTSQFENHLRAILGLPLGSTEALTPAAMVNLIGVTPPLERLLAVEDAHAHIYGKRARAGRKLGHVTVLAPDEGALEHRLRRLASAMEAG